MPGMKIKAKIINTINLWYADNAEVKAERNKDLLTHCQNNSIKER